MCFLACLPCNALKDILCLPRPPAKLHVRGKHETVAQQYGFPSGHSAINLASAWLLASDAASAGIGAPATLFALAALHTAHVCFSRFYLGVHSACDVCGGLVIGALSCVVFAIIGDAIDAASTRTLTGQLVAVAVSVGAIASYPDKRADNSAFTEPIQFSGLHVGACFGSGVLASAGLDVVYSVA